MFGVDVAHVCKILGLLNQWGLQNASVYFHHCFLTVCCFSFFFSSGPLHTITENRQGNPQNIHLLRNLLRYPHSLLLLSCSLTFIHILIDHSNEEGIIVKQSLSWQLLSTLRLITYINDNWDVSNIASDRNFWIYTPAVCRISTQLTLSLFNGDSRVSQTSWMLH